MLYQINSQNDLYNIRFISWIQHLTQTGICTHTETTTKKICIFNVGIPLQKTTEKKENKKAKKIIIWNQHEEASNIHNGFEI